ncbi:sterile alpha motif domain containing 15 [Schistosoma haematobium]|uniref:Sterile alpha motif domain containing 15 n=1 Tax=Schistosoma haematobium TaxID=6185 RepID=A0A922IL74_SCHHA|nr:sterile alpha motif domain containing 15 [Schistosoma haematobium]KAH9581862.1 sterile alpha motif domain containing 15 [Schistosoma haematobium]
MSFAEICNSTQIPKALLWDVNQVASWIEGIGYSQYKECFTENQIDGRSLINIHSSTLPHLGVTEFADIKLRFIRRIIRVVLNSMAYNCIIIILLLFITIQMDVKSSQIDMDTLKEIMKLNKDQLETLDKRVQKTRLDIEKLIGETNSDLKNHGVQSDEVIECRRMFYASEHGAIIFDDMIEKIRVNKFKSPLVTNYNFTDLINCFEKQKKHHQMEAANRNGSACYINLPPQHIEVFENVNDKLNTLHYVKSEFSKFLFLTTFGWKLIY